MTTKFFCTMRASAVLSAILVVFLGGGCQENLNDHPLDSEAEASKKLNLLEGTLKFETFDDYDDFFHNPESFELPKFENAKMVYFGGSGRIQENLRINEDANEFFEDLEDTQLFKILDQDFMVIIGDYLFSLDFNNEIVGVTEDFTLKSQMANKDFDNSNIMLFKFDEDILDILESDSNGSINSKLMIFCNDRRAGGNMEKEKFYEYSDFDNWNEVEYRVKVKHGYQKAGIYFSLMTQIKHMSRPVGSTFWTSSNTYLRLDKRYSRYKPRCRSEEFGPTSPITMAWDNKINNRPYESSRGLARYEIRSEYIFEERSTIGTGRLVTIKLDDVKDGY